MPAPVTLPAPAGRDELPHFRTPPHNLEAEQALLGAILINNRTYEKVSEFLRPEHFADPVHGRIFDACGKLIGRGQIANPITLKTYFEADGSLAEIGGTQYLARLANSVTTIINAEDYGRLVFDLHLRRELIALGETLVNDAFEPEIEVTAVDQIEQTERKLFELATTGQAEGGFQSFQKALIGAIEMAEAAHKREGKISGVPSGLTDLDAKLGGLHPSDLLILAGRPSMGKAQPLDAMVRTVTGWKRMGDLQLGDELASIDGRPSRVSGLFPQGEKAVFRVVFSDGRSTEACAEHLWRVHYRTWDAPRTLSTADLMRMLERKRYQGRLWIDTPSGHFGHSEPLPVDPWLLGALLGDGHLSGGAVMFSSEDMLEKVATSAGADFAVTHAGAYDWRITTAGGHRRAGVKDVVPNALKEALKALGLWDLSSERKFIPDVYMTAQRQARQDLLAGLLDTDGWVERWGSIRFCTSSERLARQVVELARSLGAVCSLNRKQPWFTAGGERKPGLPSFVCNISHAEPELFLTLARKRQRIVERKRQKRLTIASIQASRVTTCQCIAVTHPDHLYVTDEYVVTHNTSLATNIAFNAAKAYKEEVDALGNRKAIDGAKVAFFSLEMSAEQLATRILAEQAEISSHKIRQGEMSHEEFERLVIAAQELHSLPLFIDDTPALSVSAVRTRCRRLQRQHGLGLIIVDYLQLLRGSGSRQSESNRVNEVSEITRGLKALAKELNVPVMALSQLSRAVEQREDKRPQLSDLRESGSIEQDADVVMFVFREQYYLERAEPARRPEEAEDKFHDRHAEWVRRCERAYNVAETIIAKQRHGPIGIVRMFFDGNYTKFADLIQDGRFDDEPPHE